MKKWLLVCLVALIAFIVGGLFFPDCGGNARIEYWKGQTEEAMTAVKEVETRLEEAKKEDSRLQEEKDKEIERLRAAVKEKRERVDEIDVIISETPVPDAAKPIVALYQEKVEELEGIIKDKDAIILEWEEKFDSKVKTLIAAYVKKDLAQQEALERWERRCVSAERQVKRQKFWTFVGKGLATFHGVKAIYGAFKGRD